MRTIFIAIITMSFAASVTTLLVFLAERITTRIFSATWRYGIRVFILALFLVPLSVCVTSISIDFNRKVDATENISTMENRLPALQSMHGRSITEATPDIERYIEQESGDKSGGTLIGVLSYVWLSGMFIFILKKLKPYLEFKNRVMARSKGTCHGKAFEILESEKSEMNINRSVKLMTNNCVGTPMLIGLFKPAIILPDIDMDEHELTFIFKHELTHLLHGHLWIKAAALASNAIHWFNPLSYLLTGSINTLIEMSCDENVVRHMNVSERKHYGQVILTTLERVVSMPYGIYPAMCENKNKMKERLNNMLNYERARPALKILSIVTALLVCTIGVTASTIGFGNKDSGTNLDDNSHISAADRKVTDNDSPDTAADRIVETTVVVHRMDVSKWPVPDSYEIMTYYGENTDPVANTAFIHTGIDIKAETGDKITAVDKGYVCGAEYRNGYGNTVIIEHSNMVTTLYANCRALFVKAGDKVEAGQLIAEVGSSGEEDPHLHFEVIIDGEAQDPLGYIMQSIE